MEYYSALERKEILIHATTQMNLEDIRLNKPTTKGQILHDRLREVPRIVKFIETERMVTARD